MTPNFSLPSMEMEMDQRPSGSEQKHQILNAQTHSSLVKGATWYLCNVEWWKQWRDYTGYKSFETEKDNCNGTPNPPGRICNANLLREHLPLPLLKPKLVR